MTGQNNPKWKRTYLFPPQIIMDVEMEAEKRLKDLRIGTKTTGAMSRDILCLCVKIAMPEIEKMTKEQFKQAMREHKLAKL